MARHIIKKGPSKFEMMVGHYHGDSRHQQTVDFIVIPDGHTKSTKLSVIINSAEREDGSGESWMIRGYIAQAFFSSSVDYRVERNFEAYYRTDKREGWFRNFEAN